MYFVECNRQDLIADMQKRAIISKNKETRRSL